MSNFHEAADAIRRVSKALEGFTIAANALDSIASVDQAAKEAQAACAAAVAERDAVMVQIAQARESLIEVRSEAAVLLKDAKAKAVEVTAKAEADAKASAQVIFDGIVAQANAIEYTAKSAAGELAGQIEYNTKVVAGLKEEVEQLDISISAKQDQLDSLTSALDALKSKLA